VPGRLFKIEAFVGEFEFLDGDVVAFGAQGWANPFAWPRLADRKRATSVRASAG